MKMGEYKDFRLLHDRKATPEELQKKLDDLHKTFATLTQEEQKYANIFIHDVQNGIIVLSLKS